MPGFDNDGVDGGEDSDVSVRTAASQPATTALTPSGGGGGHNDNSLIQQRGTGGSSSRTTSRPSRHSAHHGQQIGSHFPPGVIAGLTTKPICSPLQFFQPHISIDLFKYQVHLSPGGHFSVTLICSPGFSSGPLFHIAGLLCSAFLLP